MARKVNQGGEELVNESGVMGGSSGIIPEAVQHISEPGKAASSAVRLPAPDAPPPPPVHRYEVMNQNHYGPDQVGVRVILGGAPVLLRRGKILDDLNYDIELLQRQHVQLRAVK